MQDFHVIGILTTLAALFAYINTRFIRLQMTVGLMLQSLILSGALILLAQFGLGLEKHAEEFVQSISFNEFLLQVVLSFLLFSGGLFVDLE